MTPQGPRGGRPRSARWAAVRAFKRAHGELFHLVWLHGLGDTPGLAMAIYKLEGAARRSGKETERWSASRRRSTQTTPRGRRRETR